MNQRQYTSSVHETYHLLENVLKNQPASVSSGVYSPEAVILRIDNVIFKQGPEWSSQTTSALSPLEELELINELSTYLRTEKHDYYHNPSNKL